MYLPPLLITLSITLGTPDGNRLAYLDGHDPFYPRSGTARLVTPQWIGEPGVDAAVVLTVDGLDDVTIEQAEAYLTPVLERLRKIDGRSHLSVMVGALGPDDRRLRAWVDAGLGLESHPVRRTRPLLGRDGFAAAREAVHGGLDRLARVPGNRPVAIRLLPTDRAEAPSPRILAEIVTAPSPGGNVVSIDSSVPCLVTDPGAPRPAKAGSGPSAFASSFTLIDYPFPYVVNGLVWELPWIVTAESLPTATRPGGPRTLADLKAAVGAVVARQGVCTLRLDPRRGPPADQVVALIDHVARTHGPRVRFLDLREVRERLDTHLLRGASLRDGEGLDNGVRVLDVDADGDMDVLIGNDRVRLTRLWDANARGWIERKFPVRLVGRGTQVHLAHHVRFGVVQADGKASALVSSTFDGKPYVRGAWHFNGNEWVDAPELLEGLSGSPVSTFETASVGVDKGVRLRDLDGDGRCELIAGSDQFSDVRGTFALGPGKGWKRLPFDLPGEASVVMTRQPGQRATADPEDVLGQDAGLRFIDLDGDGRLDVVYSNDRGFGVYLFGSMKTGWSRRVTAGRAGAPGALSPIVRVGGDAWQPRTTRGNQGEPLFRVGRPSYVTDNGFWARDGFLWWRNEDTADLPDQVDRRSVAELLQTAASPR